MALKDMHERLYSREEEKSSDDVQSQSTGSSSTSPVSREELLVQQGEPSDRPASFFVSVSTPAPSASISSTTPSLRRSSSISSAKKGIRGSWQPEQTSSKKKALKRDLEGPVKEKKKMATWKIISLFAGGALLLALIAVLAYCYIFRTKETFQPQDVVVEFVAERAIGSGEEVSFSVRIANNSETTLRDGKLLVQKPTTFISGSEVEQQFNDLEFAELASGGIKTFEFRGRFIGERNSVHAFSATASYSTDNFSGSRFESRGKKDMVVATVPLEITGAAQKEVASGDTVIYTVSYVNNGSAVFSDMYLDIAYPEGFEPKEFSEQPTRGNNAWSLGDLGKTVSPQQIEIRGTLSGKADENKVFSTRLFMRSGVSDIVFSEDKTSVIIARSPFEIEQVITGHEEQVVTLGDELLYTLSYKNVSGLSLSRAILVTTLEGDAYDLTTLEADGGSFDLASRKITWDASGVPALGNLGAGVSGTVSFRVKVRDLLDIKTNADKEFTLRTIATIDSPDVPQPVEENKIVTTNEHVVKVNTRAVVQVAAYYQDPSGVTTSGPIPPKVGQETTYAIHWRVTNVNNDMDEVTVRGVLPPGVKFKGQHSVTSGEALRYDERTGEVIWVINDLPAQTGLRLPVLEGVFLVSLTPAPADVGRALPLTSTIAATLAGVDTFTEQSLNFTADPLTTALPDDASIGNDGGFVVE